jgi:hypothetical protein
MPFGIALTGPQKHHGLRRTASDLRRTIFMLVAFRLFHASFQIAGLEKYMRQ